MPRAALLATAAVALAGCATFDAPSAPRAPAAFPPPADGPAQAFEDTDLPDADTDVPPEPRPGEAPFDAELSERLAARARSLIGRRGPFQAGGERFNGDCSGFVQAVYAAEGISLRGLMQRAAPDERGAVKAAWAAARESGRIFGAEEWPRPGDLLFFGDTYDRNRNGRADDPLTHIGIVDYVDGGTIYFLHRGGKGVARGAMTPGRGHEARDADGSPLNSTLRARSHPVRDGGLASELLEGYGRIEPGRVPPQLARGRPDPPSAPPEREEAEPRDGAASASARSGRPAPPAEGPPGAPVDEPYDPGTPLPPPSPAVPPPPTPSFPGPIAAAKATRAPAASAKTSRRQKKAAKAHAGARTKKALAGAKPHRKKVGKKTQASRRVAKAPARTASRFSR